MEHLIKNLLEVDGEFISISPRAQPPRRWTPGEWIEVAGPLKPYANGLGAGVGPTVAEAFRAACLDAYPQTTWRVEVDGEVVPYKDTIWARRMRLVERLDRAALFREAFPGSEPQWLDPIDETIEVVRNIGRSARPPNDRDAEDVALAFAPWRRTDADPADIAVIYVACEVAAAIGSYVAVDAVAAPAAQLAPYAIDAAILAAGVAGNTGAGAVACRCARYYFARALVPSDQHLRHVNPFRVLLEYYAAGGNWQEVERTWETRK